ncbi:MULTISPECIES: gamma carbonic anhydrase family protein [unclassified Adlercreutzia]|uniref:gamma carbonic anhydrase family protein n=1 Tax=unclassified Adlercreutzia TaxID=2636013 RepID=UPI0013EBE000|nr:MULTISPECIES: gamma carbonic anhydrase family protein [unclassified Adlercreutzia]
MNYDCMKIHPSAKIARNATVLGNVEIDEDACVLFGAVVRGDCGGRIRIGKRTNLQDLVCVHLPVGGETIIGDDVAIGHGAIVHGCVIEDHTLIGMGAIVLDGAHIGRDCLIAAGAVVTGTSDIPDGSLVMGTPGRVVGHVEQRHLDYIQGSVDEYLKISYDLVEQGIIEEGYAANGH